MKTYIATIWDGKYIKRDKVYANNKEEAEFKVWKLEFQKKCYIYELINIKEQEENKK